MHGVVQRMSKMEQCLKEWNVLAVYTKPTFSWEDSKDIEFFMLVNEDFPTVKAAQYLTKLFDGAALLRISTDPEHDMFLERKVLWRDGRWAPIALSAETST